MSKFIVKVKKPISSKKTKRAELEAEGKRWVDFVIDIETWERFKKSCGETKPSAALIALIKDSLT